MSRLTITYKPDPSDDVGRLRAAVATPDFSGMGGAWAQPEEILDFSTALKPYPLPVDPPPSLRLGYNELMGDDLIISIEVRANEPRGVLVVRSEIADDQAPLSRVRVSFRTHYPDIDRFRRQLERLSAGEISEAVLEGE